ncbi:acylneuraminate cytidylyltransferase family protein [Actinomycetota bacterium]|nr:acylneuraminate cytidylyltransferase family protein [Actinomycetota bacterium]
MTEKNRSRLVAVVPARGGSKGIHNKNLRQVAGHPLIWWTVRWAMANGLDPLVSTDSELIASAVKEMGVSAVILRPAHLAVDEAISVDVMIHALDTLKTATSEDPEWVVLLEPTSPVRSDQLLGEAMAPLLAGQATATVGVMETGNCHPDFVWYPGPEDIGFSPALEGPVTRRRQEGRDAVAPEGAIYVSNTEELRIRRSFYHEKTFLYRTSKLESIDVDDLEDLDLAERVIRSLMERYAVLPFSRSSRTYDWMTEGRLP